MEQGLKGRIIKGVGGFYTVLADGGKRYVCKARGLFRKLGKTPLPGDTVTFTVDKKGEGFIQEIDDRRNELLRPTIANIDTLLIVVSATEPEPDLELTDKLLLYCAKQRIRPVLAVNKCDNGKNEAYDRIASQYEGAVDDIIAVSAETGFGSDELSELLSGRVVCLAGQSAVGKSSLLNKLLGLDLKTGELSVKTERGKHTTRHAELIVTPSGGLTADTPGFSMLETVSIEPEEIPLMYPDFYEHSASCRFLGCMHISEPDCAVKAAVEKGELDKDRYARYVKIVNEAMESRRHRYD